MKHRILSNLARRGKRGQLHSPSPLVALPFEHSVFYHTHTQKSTLVHMYCMKCNITNCWYPEWKADSGKSKKHEHYSCVTTGGSFRKSGRQKGTSSAWFGSPANQAFEPFKHYVFYHTHTQKSTLVHMYCMKCNITNCWYPEWKADSGKSKKHEHYSCVTTGGSFRKSGRQKGTSSAWLGSPANQAGLTIKSEQPNHTMIPVKHSLNLP